MSHMNDTPEPGRCNAEVTRPVGLSLIDYTDSETDPSADSINLDPENETRLVTDKHISALELEHPDRRTIVVARPEYETVSSYLWEDYVPTWVAVSGGLVETLTDVDGVEVDDHILATDDNGLARSQSAVTPEEDPPTVSDEHEWVALDNGDIRTGYPESELVGYCERWPNGGDATRCNEHINTSPTPENRVEHGMYAKRTNYWKALTNEERVFIEELIDSWVADAPFGRDHAGKLNDLYRAAIDQHRYWNGIDEYEEDGEIKGLVTEDPIVDDEGELVRDDQGEVVTMEEEHPANLPLSRISKDVMSTLKELDVVQEEDETANAVDSLAEALSGDED